MNLYRTLLNSIVSLLDAAYPETETAILDIEYF